MFLLCIAHPKREIHPSTMCPVDGVDAMRWRERQRDIQLIGVYIFIYIYIDLYLHIYIVYP